MELVLFPIIVPETSFLSFFLSFTSGSRQDKKARSNGTHAVRLPNDFQSKLNLPRRGGCGINRPSSPYRRPVLIEEDPVGKGCLEVGVVQDVKELGAELNVERFRDFFDVVVLDGREIEVEQARPDYAVSPGIAK